jgi:hypothetical protein
LKETDAILTRKKVADIFFSRPVIYCLMLVIFAHFQSQMVFAQINTTVKYSSDLERQISMARDIQEDYKQFRKDSSKIVKQQFKDLKRTTDSLTAELNKQVEISNLQPGLPEPQEMAIRQHAAMTVIHQKFRDTGKYSKISRKELQSMVLQNTANLPELRKYRSLIDEELLPYKTQLNQYKHLPQSADSLKQQISAIDVDSTELWQELDKMVESEVMKNNYYQAFMKEKGELSMMNSGPESLFKDNIPEFDGAAHPMKTARQAGKKYFEDINGNLDQGVSKIDGLKKKYDYVPDSKDLSTARKANTLDGAPVKKRIVIGGDLHMDIGDPLFLDFNPMIGYRLDKRWMAGISGMFRFRLSHTDSTGIGYRIPTTGGRGFGEYRFYKSFLAHVEYEVLVKDVFSTEMKNTSGEPTQSINVGLGNTFNLYKGLKGRLLILYNFTLDGENQYRSPWVVRFGFMN